MILIKRLYKNSVFSIIVATTAHASTARSLASWAYVRRNLRAAHLSSPFINALHKAYNDSDFNSVVELNCLLFLRKTDYHTPQVTPEAVKEVRRFMQAHRKLLLAAQKKYGVSASVISGLLWLESRYGQNSGTLPLPNVFADLLQANRYKVLDHLRKTASPRFTAQLNTKKVRQIEREARKKKRWALDQLRALEWIFKRDKKLFARLRGSYAGAFGMPQFIPSSYKKYARARRLHHTPDLTRADDAIFSVAYYLKVHGWKRNRPQTYEQALLRYNHSEDYARAILTLAKQATSRRTFAKSF